MNEAIYPYGAGGRDYQAEAFFGALSEVLPRERWPGRTLADALSGSGALAWTAKRAGFRVLANDLAMRAYLTARAIIANSRPLPTRRLGTLLRPLPQLRAERWKLAEYFPLAVLMMADAAWQRARSDVERYLALRLLTDAHDFDGDIPTYALLVCERINAGIFDNGQACAAFQRDAAGWLPTVQADVAILDPPMNGPEYFDAYFWTVDQFMGLPVQPEAEPDENVEHYAHFLRRFLDAASAIPYWLIPVADDQLDVVLAEIEARRPIAVCRLLPGAEEVLTRYWVVVAGTIDDRP